MISIIRNLGDPKDWYGAGKDAAKDAVSGSPISKVLFFLAISIGLIFLRVFLERLKESNPGLAYLIAGSLLVIVIVVMAVNL